LYFSHFHYYTKLFRSGPKWFSAAGNGARYDANAMVNHGLIATGAHACCG
jgi:hypothetical protein